MVKNALLCFALVSTGMTDAALALGVNRATAADDCVTESNLVPPKGSRWNYYIDRKTNRKCWFLMKLTTAPAAPQMRHTLPRSTVATVSPEHREPSTSSQTAQSGTRKLSESEQAALFLQFLRWKEQQGSTNNRAGEPSSKAISP